MSTATRARSEPHRQPAPSRKALGSARRCACGGLTGHDGLCDRCRSTGTSQTATPTTTGGRSGHDFARVSVEKQPGIAHGPGGATNTFEDCPPAWRPLANTATALGRSWVANAINGLSALPTPIPVPVSTLLNKHFHTTYDRDIRAILGRYRRINAGLNSSIDFECETSCKANVDAYVWRVWSDVHLCPNWFRSGPRRKANVIVHELAHDVAGCKDAAYAWEPGYNRLSVDEAIDNADSYSHFAEEAAGP